MMRYCPICRSEYEDAVVSCADCGALLVSLLLPEEFGSEPVVVYEAATITEATTVAATLTAEGVLAFVPPPDLSPVVPQPTATQDSYPVIVPASAVDRAREVLAEPPLTEAELADAEEADPAVADPDDAQQDWDADAGRGTPASA